MCGFSGALNADSNFEKEQVARLASNVSFRGPDSCNVILFDDSFTPASSGNSAVFFNRLAILDLDPRSDQPFSDEHHLLLFNGEIYNYQELKDSLRSEGISFRTTSDTEVLFFALKTWGKEAIPKLNGMFAFCWIDKKTRAFLIARDRLGIKPFYYSLQNKSLLFSSELDTIRSFSATSPEISPEAVDMYMWLQFVPTPHTIYKNIFKLPPGHYIQGTLNETLNEIVPVSYWDAYDAVSGHASIATQDGTLETALKNSLLRQLHSDVPLGLFLSSGVDSSLLAAMVNKHFSGDNQFDFFTVRFSEQTTSDESFDAENFIRGFHNSNLRSHHILIDSSLIGDHLENLYSFYDEPFGDPAALLNWVISAKAREHVTVAISGDGADELFWGYSRYERWRQFYNRNTSFGFGSARRITDAILPSGRTKYNIKWAGEPDPVKLHYNFFLPSGVRFKINDHISTKTMWALNGVHKIARRTDLPAILDIKSYLADAMLYKVDRSSMAASLEVRVPYLDNEVLDFALQMPLSEKSTAEYAQKAPLKKLLKELAPHYNIHQKKKGFSFPLQQWLQTKWKDRLHETVTKRNLESVGLDDRYYEVYKEFNSTGKYFTDVWFMFNLLLWNEKRN